MIFSRVGVPTDSFPVRIYGGHRGQRLPVEAARVEPDTSRAARGAPVRYTDATGQAWLVSSNRGSEVINVKFIGALPLHRLLPSGVLIDSVHVFLQLDTPLMCAARRHVQPAAG